MPDLAGRGPLGPKPPKPAKRPRKPIPRMSAKKRAHKAFSAWFAERAHGETMMALLLSGAIVIA